MPQNYPPDSYRPYPAGPFDITVVRLIDGYIGQVMFGGEIIHQTELVPNVWENPARDAADKAQKAAVDAMRKLFAQ